MLRPAYNGGGENLAPPYASKLISESADNNPIGPPSAEELYADILAQSQKGIRAVNKCPFIEELTAGLITGSLSAEEVLHALQERESLLLAQNEVASKTENTAPIKAETSEDDPYADHPLRSTYLAIEIVEEDGEEIVIATGHDRMQYLVDAETLEKKSAAYENIKYEDQILRAEKFGFVYWLEPETGLRLSSAYEEISVDSRGFIIGKKYNTETVLGNINGLKSNTEAESTAELFEEAA